MTSPTIIPTTGKHWFLQDTNLPDLPFWCSLFLPILPPLSCQSSAAEPQHRRTARLLLVTHHSQEQPNCEYSDATTLIQTALCSTQAHLNNSQPDNDPYKIRFSEEPQLLLPLGVSPNPWPLTQLLHPSSHPSGSFHINLTLLVSSHQLPQLLQSAKCIYVSGIFCLVFFSKWIFKTIF